MRHQRFLLLASIVCGLCLFEIVPAHAAEGAPSGEQASAEHTEHAEHGSGEDHDPSFEDVNWFYGFLGEKADVEPDLLWRTPGMPVPFCAHLFNTAVVFFLMYRFGKGAVQSGLKERRARIVKGIEDASKMKAEAQAALEGYESKLQKIEEQIERVRHEMREMGEAERERILAEARERQGRMEREARLLIDQEIKAARERLHNEVVSAAFKSALATLEAQVTPADHQRLGQAYLSLLTTGPRVFSKGGDA